MRRVSVKLLSLNMLTVIETAFKEIAQFPGEFRTEYGCPFDPENKQFLTFRRRDDRSVNIWNIESGELINQHKFTEKYKSLCVSPQMKDIMFAYNESVIKFSIETADQIEIRKNIFWHYWSNPDYWDKCCFKLIESDLLLVGFIHKRASIYNTISGTSLMKQRLDLTRL